MKSATALRVTLLGSGWSSSMGGSSTINRQLAIQLAKHSEVEVTFLVPQSACSEDEKRMASSHNVSIREANKLAGFSDPLDWLSFPPRDLVIDFVLGHGVKLGKQAQVIRNSHNCKWIQVVQIASVELSMFRTYPSAISRTYPSGISVTEVELYKLADVAVAVGAELSSTFSAQFPSYNSQDILLLTPGIFPEFTDIKQALQESAFFKVLTFGRGDTEDISLKSYDIAARAIVELKDKSYRLIFVGAPYSKQDEVATKLLENGIERWQLVVRNFLRSKERLKELFCEVDLCIMPSRAEGFGLTALEALSAGLPILVSGYSGFGEALCTLPLGKSFVVESEDPREWAKAIAGVRQKERSDRLQGIKQLRSSYAEKFSWEKQCDILVEKMWDIVHVPPEVHARGPQALEAYNNALAEGQTCDKRVPLMIVGQDRSGKTSVKKSLRGICFNPDENSTLGMEVDRYDFKVTTEIWKTGEKDEDNIETKATSYEYITARWIAGKWKTCEKIAEVKKASSAESNGYDFKEIDNTKEREPYETLSDVTLLESSVNPTSTNVIDNEPKLATREVRNPTELEPEEDWPTTVLKKLPDLDDVTKLLSQFPPEYWEDDKEDIYSILWDFAGQSVYYVTHPLFLTRRAIYFLVYDLSRKASDEATSLMKQGVYRTFSAHEYSLKTNFDYLDFWMSSLASLVNDCQQVDPEKLEPGNKKFPAVFLVCTHADEPHHGRNPFELAYEILGDLKNKPYGAHLVDVFCVDNTKSGTESECKEIVRLRETVHFVSKELPHVTKAIPIKWLKYEKALCVLKESDYKFISLSTAKKVAAKLCNIKDHEVEKVLTFLHDLRVLIYFEDSPELSELVFLDIQWLIDVFKNVITVRAYPVERDFAPLWEKLEKKGILEENLLKHVWNSLVPQKETHESLIAIMEKFSLMCPWPSSDDLCNKQYLVPSMLQTLPPKKISDLVRSAKLPSLFLKFETGRVPPGLFPRLVLEFFQWCRKEFSGIDLRKTYRNFARFYNFPNQGLSLVLLCHSSTIEVVVLSVKRGTDVVDVDSIRAFRNQLTSIIDRVWKKFFWVKNVGCEVSFLCPVCSYRRMVSFCPQHNKESCEQEDCLHFISESDLKDEKEAVCTYSETTLDNSIYVEQFAPWISSGKEKGLSSSDVTARSHGEASEINPMKSATALRVTLLGSEWSSSMGGLSTINRQLAIQLAKHSEVEVTLLVPQSACSEEEKRMASRHNVSIREAKKLVGYSDCLEWLISPPGDLVIDFVLGHGAKLGKQAQVIRRSRRCKWIQVVHTAPEELAMYKDYPKAITKGDEKNSTEVELCKSADVVLAVGPKLRDTFSAQLRSCKSQDDILQLTPGTFCEFYDSKQEEEEHKKFYVLTFGRGDLEDFSLKGYDISARAIVELKDRSYRLIFVGAPDGKQDEVAAKLRDSKIDESQLVVRKFVQSQERLKELFSEVDLCIMPSRAEGFGLTALEALSAGLPILVSGNSGFGEALCTLPLGKSFVVESEDPREWAKAIAGVRQKERSDRLQGIKQLKISYEEKFSWEKQCDILVEKMRDIVEGSQGRIIQELQQMQLDASKVKSRTDLSLGLRNIASERGFRISDNEGLGNCMFYALSEQLEIVKGIKIPHGELRQNLVQYLRSNPKLPDGTDLFHFVHGHQTWTEYLVHVEQDGGWGDHVILCAAANYFRMCIRVVSSLSNSNDVIITPHCPVDESKPLVLGHIHEVHYVSLQPVQG